MMSAREPARHALYSELQHVLGPEHADTLMTYLPQHRSEDVATRGDIAGLRSDMRTFRTEIRDEIGTFKTEIRADIGAFKTEIRANIKELKEIVRDQQKIFIGTVVGSMTALTAIFALVVGSIG